MAAEVGDVPLGALLAAAGLLVLLLVTGTKLPRDRASWIAIGGLSIQGCRRARMKALGIDIGGSAIKG